MYMWKHARPVKAMIASSAATNFPGLKTVSKRGETGGAVLWQSVDYLLEQ